MNKVDDPTFSNQLPERPGGNILVYVSSKSLIIVLYEISEQSMNNDVGYLAFVKVDPTPNVILKPDRFGIEAWSEDSVKISSDENFAIFRRSVHMPDRNIDDYSFIIFRLSDLSFGFYKMEDGFDYRPIEISPLKFELRERVQGKFTDKVGGEIDINSVKFYPVSEIGRIFEIYAAEKPADPVQD